MKKIVSVLLLLCLCIFLFGCAKSKAASDCENLINNIGDISLNSETAIVNAETAFSLLSDKEKEQIHNSELILSSARAEYDTLLKNTVDSFIADIDSIGEISLDSGELIDSLSKRFDTLPFKVKGMITNYKSLVAAEKEFKEIEAADREQRLENLLNNFVISEDKIDEILWFNHKDAPQYIDSRSYVLPYIGVKTNLDYTNAWICIRYNCVCGELLLWDSWKMVIDEEHFSKDMGLLNTNFDTSGFAYWEYFDEVLNLNQRTNSQEITLLKKISESKEAIIRFQGSSHHFDSIISQQDKDIIKDVLELYSLLINE